MLTFVRFFSKFVCHPTFKLNKSAQIVLPGIFLCLNTQYTKITFSFHVIFLLFKFVMQHDEDVDTINSIHIFVPEEKITFYFNGYGYKNKGKKKQKIQHLHAQSGWIQPP